jgi:hypothetical protein
MAGISGGLFGLAFWKLALVMLTAQTPMSSTQAIGFDYSDTGMERFTVTRFEVKYDTGSFTSVQIPPSFVGGLTPNGYKTYKLVPPFTSGSHSVQFRACNATGCGGSSAPFTFVSASSPALVPGEVPSQVRVVAR